MQTKIKKRIICSILRDVVTDKPARTLQSALQELAENERQMQAVTKTIY